MSTVQRIGRFKIQVFADHPPPHFHIVCGDFEALVLLSDFTILKGKRHEREMAEPLAWAVENRELLIREWIRLNEL